MSTLLKVNRLCESSSPGALPAAKKRSKGGHASCGKATRAAVRRAGVLSSRHCSPRLYTLPDSSGTQESNLSENGCHYQLHTHARRPGRLSGQHESYDPLFHQEKEPEVFSFGDTRLNRWCSGPLRVYQRLVLFSPITALGYNKFPSRFNSNLKLSQCLVFQLSRLLKDVKSNAVNGGLARKSYIEERSVHCTAGKCTSAQCSCCCWWVDYAHSAWCHGLSYASVLLPSEYRHQQQRSPFDACALLMMTAASPSFPLPCFPFLAIAGALASVRVSCLWACSAASSGSVQLAQCLQSAVHTAMRPCPSLRWRPYDHAVCSQSAYFDDPSGLLAHWDPLSLLTTLSTSASVSDCCAMNGRHSRSDSTPDDTKLLLSLVR